MFVDTNYFLRFLLKDVNKQYQIVKTLFLDASKGKIKLLTSTIVFFEIYWVLRSLFNNQKSRIVNTLQKILALQFIDLLERQILRSSLILFNKSSLSLEDCYNLSYSKSLGVKSIKTFDKKLEQEFEK